MDDTRSKTGTGPALRARRLYADRRMAESLRSRGWLVLEPASLIRVEDRTDAVGLRQLHVLAIDPTGCMPLPACAIDEMERRP